MTHLAISPPTKRGLSRVEAAQYIGVSATTFDGLVCAGDMPQPKRVGKRKLWDVKAVDSAFDELPGDSIGTNEWDTLHETAN